jgi:hypothetical protein
LILYSSSVKNKPTEYHYHPVANRYLQQPLTLRDVPNILLENEFVQDIFETIAAEMSSSSNQTTINNVNKTQLSLLVSTAMKKHPYDPSGIDAQLKFSKLFFV